MEHIIYKRNIWTHETTELCRMPDSYSADRRSMRLNEELRRQGDIEHYTYFEPACGWDEAARILAAMQ